jgi:hypothetical protein
MGRHARDYKSLDAVKAWESIEASPALKECLSAWMQDMKTWGEVVRDDIIRLEGAVGLSTGDTGDPPPAPRK